MSSGIGAEPIHPRRDLRGTIGATTVCAGTIDGAPGTVRVTTTEVRGRDVGSRWEQIS